MDRNLAAQLVGGGLLAAGAGLVWLAGEDDPDRTFEEGASEAEGPYDGPQWSQGMSGPIPNSYEALRALYGDFDYAPAPHARIKPDPDWVRANIRRFTLFDGKRPELHVLVGAEFAELYEQACKASGYHPKSVQTYVPRHKQWNVEKALSLHSWGIAIDFDPKLNGVNATSPAMPPAFADVFRQAGWFWGGDWHSYKDFMHIQRAGGAI